MSARTRTAFLAITLATACNQVLGIEAGELNLDLVEGGTGAVLPPSESDGTGGTSPMSAGGSTGLSRSARLPRVECAAPSQSCADCLATCAGASRNDCLGDSYCRQALDAYRACLGDACMDSSDQRCAETYLHMQLDPTVRPLAASTFACLGDACAVPCERSPAASVCELYCSCMDTTCRGRGERSGTDVDLAACIQQCSVNASAQDVAKYYCRLTHCEAAALTALDLHCDHARPGGPCPGDELIAVTDELAAGCTDKGLPGFFCTEPSECCSGICDDQGICSNIE